MNAYEDCRTVEQRGNEMLHPLLRQRAVDNW